MLEKKASNYLKNAIESIGTLDDSDAKNTLIKLVKYFTQREY